MSKMTKNVYFRLKAPSIVSSGIDIIVSIFGKKMYDGGQWWNTWEWKGQWSG